MKQIVIKIDLPENEPNLRPDDEIIENIKPIIEYEIADTCPFTVEIVNKN